MKIAIISPWAISLSSVGGTERFCIDLAEGLQRHGHSVTVCMLSGKNQTVNGIAYISLDLLGEEQVATEYDLRRLLGDFSQPKSFDSLARFVESKIAGEEFDAMHINSLLFSRAWQQKRRIFTIHTNPYEYALDWGKPSYERMVNLLTVEARNLRTTLIAPSSYYAGVFSQAINETVHCIPHAIDTSRLITKESRTILQKKYNIPSNKMSVLLPSRLEPTQKRPQIVFEALSMLPADQREHIQIIASGLDSQYGNFRNQLQAVADTAHIEAHFLRFDTMAEAYALADIVALPSHSESFGYAALESLSLDKPTILNNIAPYCEIGAGNPNAYFFDDTADTFCAEMTKLLAMIHRNQSTPQAWTDRYDIDRWIDSYEELLAL